MTRRLILFLDLGALILLILSSVFLVGYYTQYSYLETGYQDWMHQLFRLETLDRNGLTSWDHIWSNGMNYWRSYQYLPHLAVVGIHRLTGLPLPQTMMWAVVAVFVFLRIELYILLRRLPLSPVVACFTTLITLAFIQQWVAIKDFSLFLGLPVLLPFFFIWIKAMRHVELLPLTASFAGVLWLIHPVFGYSAAGLFAFALLFPARRLSLLQLGGTLLLYAVTVTAFFLPYFLYGYRYANPIYALPQFLREILVRESLGLSVLYWAGVVGSWAVLFIEPERFPRWAKLLLLYCTLYLAAIVMGQAGYLPALLNTLQISRGVVVLGFALPFVFGMTIQLLAQHLDQRFRIGVFAALSALIIGQSISLAHVYGGRPVQSAESPVAAFFASSPRLTGSVFIEDVAKASALTDGSIRFSNSYNEHLEPHPLAQRFRRLLKTDLSYSSLSPSQVRLIQAYARVLGVEYIFLPSASPTVSQLLRDAQASTFQKIQDVQTSDESFAVLQHELPTITAFLLPHDAAKEQISETPLAQPTIRVETSVPWDEQVLQLSTLLDDPRVRPVPLSYQGTAELVLQLPADMKQSTLHLQVSYDPYWQVVVDENVRSDLLIRPTALRFQLLTLPDELAGKTITLRHRWPTWYWPAQVLSGMVFLLVLGVTIVLLVTRRVVIASVTADRPTTEPFKPKRIISSVPSSAPSSHVKSTS